MQPLNPEFLVVAHLPRRVRHDGIQILTHEGTGIVARYLCRVDDGRTRCDECLEIVHEGHALAERLLRLLAIRNIGPGAYDLRGASLVVRDDPKGVLHPDVMPITMAEAVFDRASAPFHQRAHFLKYPPSIIWMQAHGPEIFVLQHLPRREPHDPRDILAHERARVITCLIHVDDGRRYRHQVSQTLLRCLQLNGALSDPLFQFVMRLPKSLLLTFPRSEIGREANRTDLLAVFGKQNGG